MRVIVAESDPAVAEAIGNFIRKEGDYSYITESGEDALSVARFCEFDALVVGTVSTDLSSIQTVRTARIRNLSVMVIALADGGAKERKKFLDIGADDCMGRTPDLDELMARLRAMTRRAYGHESSTVVVGDLSINLATKKFTVLGNEVLLRPKEYSFLRLLMLRREIVDKGSVRTYLYNGEKEPDSRSIDTLVCRIRKKITTAGGSTIPETIWGYGYRIIAPKKKQYAAA